METTTLSTKGQLVIPARVRDALHLESGHRFAVTVEHGNIVLKPEVPALWTPLNPKGASLSAAELSQPVDLSDEASRR
ncbi:MAG: AbrB/MazE/SpoVT family DNA-binding domain-containing protein [Betaproteobacteria bacterium]|nr:AbrB/MazE/SpoVT family DNA-binding domain-containing protein [Betaproteobacteria bacterium]MCL2886180.1 AbrB/MazE/SpoVT family DNA-binding domain-containing protein [Betaproteobacteria bacterium]